MKRPERRDHELIYHIQHEKSFLGTQRVPNPPRRGVAPSGKLTMRSHSATMARSVGKPCEGLVIEPRKKIIARVSGVAFPGTAPKRRSCQTPRSGRGRRAGQTHRNGFPGNTGDLEDSPQAHKPTGVSSREGQPKRDYPRRFSRSLSALILSL